MSHVRMQGSPAGLKPPRPSFGIHCPSCVADVMSSACTYADLKLLRKRLKEEMMLPRGGSTPVLEILITKICREIWNTLGPDSQENVRNEILPEIHWHEWVPAVYAIEKTLCRQLPMRMLQRVLPHHPYQAAAAAVPMKSSTRPNRARRLPSPSQRGMRKHHAKLQCPGEPAVALSK